MLGQGCSSAYGGPFGPNSLSWGCPVLECLRPPDLLLIVRTLSFDRISPGLPKSPLGGNIGSRLGERRTLPGKGDNGKVREKPKGGKLRCDKSNPVAGRTWALSAMIQMETKIWPSNLYVHLAF